MPRVPANPPSVPLRHLLDAMQTDPSSRGAIPAAAYCDRVLIIDDEAETRDTFRQFLQGAQFEVVTAAGGADGLGTLQADPFIRLVLLDLSMPNMDGWRFRHEQRADARLALVPTIIVTGAPLDRVVHQELDAADYLLKPVGREHLISVVAGYCRPKDGAS